MLSSTPAVRETVRMALDPATFGPISESLRRDLLLHCYRFTGSVQEAEDLVQETLARAWRGRAGYRGEAGLRTWLHRIATRAGLDAIRRQRRRTLPSALEPGHAGEVLWLEPMPDDLLADAAADPAAAYELRESVSLAFLTALQLLPPKQRAVLLLRDVLALRASEVADLLQVSVSGVNSLLHRARRTMRHNYVRPATVVSPNPRTARLLQRYIAAWEAGDIDALLATLRADALLEMPPIPSVSAGHAAIRDFLSPGILDGRPDRWRGMPTTANGGPAVALYRRDEGRYRFTGLQLLAADDGDRIGRVTAYMDPQLAGRFRLPGELAVHPA